MPRRKARKACDAGQIGHAGLVRRRHIRQPQKWHPACLAVKKGSAHQAECKAGQAGSVAGLRAAELCQRRLVQAAAEPGVEDVQAGADQVRTCLRGLLHLA